MFSNKGCCVLIADLLRITRCGRFLLEYAYAHFSVICSIYCGIYILFVLQRRLIHKLETERRSGNLPVCADRGIKGLCRYPEVSDLFWFGVVSIVS